LSSPIWLLWEVPILSATIQTGKLHSSDKTQTTEERTGEKERKENENSLKPVVL
jgi:hypothetical protein